MNKKRLQEISSRGGKTAHEKGTIHKFTLKEVKAGGKKGGSKPRI